MKTAKFAMVVHQAAEGGYWAAIPELPGCFTQGETLDELRCNAQEAIIGHLAAMADRGESAPETGILVEAVETELRADGAG